MKRFDVLALLWHLQVKCPLQALCSDHVAFAPKRKPMKREDGSMSSKNRTIEREEMDSNAEVIAG